MKKNIQKNIGIGFLHRGLNRMREIYGACCQKPLFLRTAQLLAITSAIFCIGLGVGLGAGAWLERPADSSVRFAKSLADSAPVDDETDTGYQLSVRVLRSERALEKFVYQEELPPEILQQDGPAMILDQAPAVSALDAEQQEGSSKPPEADIIMRESSGKRSAKESSDALDSVAALPPARDADATQEAVLSDIPLWQQHAVSVNVAPGIPLIAIVIDDMGIDQARSRIVAGMAGPMTLSFIPYGSNLQKLVNLARENGHEIMLHMPMEPLNPRVNPGPNALLTSLDHAEIRSRLRWGLDQFDDYVGVNNHMGSKFTAWEPGMKLVMQEMAARGLLFMDSITSRDSVAYKMARASGVTATMRDVFLDHTVTRDDIRNQLRKLEKKARQQGYAVAIGHPHDETISVLSEWLPEAEKRGFALVPVSKIARLFSPG